MGEGQGLPGTSQTSVQMVGGILGNRWAERGGEGFWVLDPRMSMPLYTQDGRGLRRRAQPRWEKSIPQSYIDWHSRKGVMLQVRTRSQGRLTGARNKVLTLVLAPGLRKAAGPKCLNTVPSCPGVPEVLFPDIREALEASSGLGHDRKLSTVLCYAPQGCVPGCHQPLPQLALGSTSGLVWGWVLVRDHGWPCAQRL